MFLCIIIIHTHTQTNSQEEAAAFLDWPLQMNVKDNSIEKDVSSINLSCVLMYNDDISVGMPTTHSTRIAMDASGFLGYSAMCSCTLGEKT